MIIAASAYFPPITCQGVGHGTKPCPIQEERDKMPAQLLGEDVGELVQCLDPFEVYLLLIKELVDGVKFAIDVAMLLACCAVGADVNHSFVVAQDEWRQDGEEI
jgi:hypothetical protein